MSLLFVIYKLKLTRKIKRKLNYILICQSQTWWCPWREKTRKKRHWREKQYVAMT